jgi:hypothetical protein
MTGLRGIWDKLSKKSVEVSDSGVSEVFGSPISVSTSSVQAGRSIGVSESVVSGTDINRYSSIRSAMNEWVGDQVQTVQNIISGKKYVADIIASMNSSARLATISYEVVTTDSNGNVKLNMWPLYEAFAEQYLKQMSREDRQMYFDVKRKTMTASVPEVRVASPVTIGAQKTSIQTMMGNPMLSETAVAESDAESAVSEASDSLLPPTLQGFFRQDVIDGDANLDLSDLTEVPSDPEFEQEAVDSSDSDRSLELSTGAVSLSGSEGFNNFDADPPASESDVFEKDDLPLKGEEE